MLCLQDCLPVLAPVAKDYIFILVSTKTNTCVFNVCLLTEQGANWGYVYYVVYFYQLRADFILYFDQQSENSINILEIPIKHKLLHFFHYFSFLLIKLMPVYYQNSNTRNNVENVWILVPYSPNDGYTYTMQLIKWIKYIHM